MKFLYIGRIKDLIQFLDNVMILDSYKNNRKIGIDFQFIMRKIYRGLIWCIAFWVHFTLQIPKFLSW